MPSQFHNDDDGVQELDKLVTGVDSFIVDDITPSSEEATDEEEVFKEKKRTSKKKKRFDKTIDIDSDELNDLQEMNGSFLKSTRSRKPYTSTAPSGDKVHQRGRRIYMMADSSDEENVPPVQKFVQEISSDEEKVGSKPILPDHINDNTYDYNDSFID